MGFADYWVCPSCKSLNRDRARQCYRCHTDRPADAAPGQVALDPIAQAPVGWGTPPPPTPATPPNGVPAAPPSTPAGAAPGSAAAAAAPLAPGGIYSPAGGLQTASPPAPVLPAAPANVLGGLVGGLAGAVIATFVWFGFVVLTDFQAGLVAIAVGAIVGYGVVLGAGGRASFALIPLSVALALGALCASEYLIVLRIGNDVAREAGVPLDAIVATDPVSLVAFGIQADPVSLVFWAIALFEAFVIPWRRIMSRR